MKMVHAKAGEGRAAMGKVAVLALGALDRDVLCRALDEAGYQTASQLPTFPGLLGWLAEVDPKVVVLDTHCLSPLLTSSLLRKLDLSCPQLPLLVLYASSPPATEATLLDRSSASADELLSKVAQLSRIAAARRPSRLRKTSEAMASLTPRERQVLEHLAVGHDNLKIAAMLGITERTVKAHLRSLLRKLGTDNRTHLALLTSTG